MKPLLDWFPDLRVIHLVRDPRAVALSRRDFHESARGQFAESTKNLSERTIREAATYCRQVVIDTRWRKRLEKEFPGRLYSLTYEKLVEDPAAQASDIYRFIDETLDQRVLDSFVNLAEGNKNHSAKWLAARWLYDRISHSEFERITTHCSEFFKFYPEFLNSLPQLFRTKDLFIATRPPRRSKYRSINSRSYTKSRTRSRSSR